MSEIIKFKEVEEKLLTVRGERVLIDRDVAELYGVETKRVNEAVANNTDKFPDGYLVELSGQEKSELVENFDRFNKLKHSTALPTAFTEKGLYMLATILKSPRATQTTIAIVETFTKMRELTRSIALLSEVKGKKQQEALMQKSGEILAEVLDDDSLEISGDETTFELNLAFVKLKKTIKRSKKVV